MKNNAVSALARALGGNAHTQLTVDREDPDGYVSFDGNSWDAKDGWVMDRLASSVCKFAIKN